MFKKGGQMKQIIIYFDLDGVLAKRANVPVKRTHKKRFFLRRRLQENVRDTISILNKKYDTAVLTAAYKDAHSENNKRVWADRKRIPVSRIIVVPCGKDKARYVSKGSINILVDDYSENLRKWERNGDNYVGIKFYNGINGNHLTWKGHSIFHEMMPEEIASVIEKIAEDTALRLAA